MKLRERIRNFLVPSATNSQTANLANQFLRYGGRGKPMGPDWSQVMVSDRDLYSGYNYAAIRNRANRVAQLALENVVTDATKPIMEKARESRDEVTHPYLDFIDTSSSFSNYMFWYTISTYLDLEGVFYLFALRAVNGERVGNIQEFKLLNPYDVQPVFKESTLEIGGYVETRRGFQREIPKEMIIDMRDLNPFDWLEPLAMTDAAKDSQFTLKQAGDFVRHSLKNNIAAPGIISTGIVLDDPTFANFISRIRSQEKGEPLFANGPGAIDWKSMQVELNNAGIDKINSVNLDQLIAVTGVSKTTFGIEQSGVTRETSKTQSDLFVTNQIIPRLQTILDALNQDYKNKYANDYKRNEYSMTIDSPLGTDHDAELVDVDLRQKSYDLYNNLVNKGYDRDRAARYAIGEITLEELGEPTNPPIEPPLPDPNSDGSTSPTPDNTPPNPPPPKTKQEAVTHDENFTDNAGGNPNHDKRGRFSSGPGGGFADYGRLNDQDYERTVLGEDSPFSGQPQYTPDQSRALGDYSFVLYAPINNGLRRGKGKVVKKEFVDSNFPTKVQEIDKAVNSHFLPANAVLYRGSRLKKTIRPGDTIQDFGFVSTSFSQGVADSLVPQGKDAYIFKIKAKKGTAGALIAMATVGVQPEVVREEREFLLPRGSKLTVLTVKFDSAIKKNVVEAVV